MNVYDFDGTIYDGDSSVDFFLFVLKRKPSLIRYTLKQAQGFFLYELNRIKKTELKEYFFCFLPGIDAQNLANDFWKKNRHKIFSWYLDLQQPNDLIISASPEFLLEPICKQLGISHLIASKVDAHSGKFIGENCRGAEKVRRLVEEFHITGIDKFYSDSLSDLPLAQIANQAFLIKNGTITVWDHQ